MQRFKRLALRLLLAAAVTPSSAAQEPDDRAKRLAEFNQTHKLEQSKLYTALGEKGYLKNAEVVKGPPEAASFGVMLDGKVSRLLYMPAQDGEPPVPEGLYLVPEGEDGVPRPLNPDPRSGGLNSALGGALRQARRAPAAPAGADPAVLARVAQSLRPSDGLRDAVAGSFDGANRRSQLEARIAGANAEIARKQAVSDRQWARTPSVARRVAGSLSCVVPPPIKASEISRAARLDRPVTVPKALDGGRPGIVMLVSGEAEGKRVEAALKAHEAAVKKTLAARLREDPLGGAADLLAAPLRSPKRAVALLDAAPGLDDGARQASAGLARMPAVGAGVGLAEQPQAGRAQRVWNTPIRGRIARRKVDQGTDLGRAQREFAAERANIVRLAGDTAALEVIKSDERLRKSFGERGMKDVAVLATGSTQEAARLRGLVGGRGAFLQYRTSDGGSYFLPLTPEPSLVAGRKDYAEVAARADARVSSLSRGGTLTPAAARAAWAAEIARAWKLPPAEAAALAERLHGAR
ncbi:MAG: hypothetical protein HY928_11980 [Elusimicrobia bacterium]|nr:hypothetical protein [Elusimicrobiota bacterium]